MAQLKGASVSRLADKLAAIERIRAPLEAENIPVPGIVVTGNQSAGKSSVLEHLSGISFPRAENTCTKLPAILRMERLSGQGKPYAMVSMKADFAGAEKVDLKEVGNTIQQITDTQTKSGPLIQDTPIHIKIAKRDGPTLCLIDLPGITHVSGIDSFDIHKATTDIVKKFIHNKEMVILCVVPAMDDFANCEAIKLAQKVDPTGRRTLGVVTKCDMVPTTLDDSDIIDKILMQRDGDVKLEMGFHAVCNRSPKEIKESTTADALSQKEKALFKEHAALKHLPAEKTGTEQLVDRITAIQEETVNEYLPKLKVLLHGKIRETTAELQKMQPSCDTDADKFSKFVAIVTEVHRELKELTDATSVRTDKKLHVAPRAYEKMAAMKTNMDKELPNWFSDAMTKMVADRVQEVRGAQLDNFLSHPVFRAMIVEAFDDKLKEHAATLTKEMVKLVTSVYNTLVDAHAAQFPRLAEALRDEAQALLQDMELQTSGHVEAMIGAETYIFTQDSFYNLSVETVTAGMLDRFADVAIGALDKSLQLKDSKTLEDVKAQIGEFQKRRAKSSGKMPISEIDGIPKEFADKCKKLSAEGEQSEMQLNVMKMQASLHVYSIVVKRRVYDLLPMLIYRGIVLLTVQRVQPFMFEKFRQGDRLSSVMDVDPSIVAHRKRMQSRLHNFESALKQIRELA